MATDTWIRRIGNELLDLVYPPYLYCISCGKIIDESRTYRLCNDCMQAMNWITGRHCPVCGKPLAETDPGESCFACNERAAAGRPHSFDKGHACAGYGACEQSLIFAMKYGSRSDIGGTLGEIMYDRMAAEYGTDVLAGMYDLVIPVPIYRDKKLTRGYNHADLIAESFAKRAGLRYDPDIVIRTRNTAPMKGLGPEERQHNIRGAFRLRESRLPLLSRASILLVDDIFTTGATIDEIASLLKEDHVNEKGETYQGASRVDFIAYAGGRDMISR